MMILQDINLFSVRSGWEWDLWNEKCNAYLGIRIKLEKLETGPGAMRTISKDFFIMCQSGKLTHVTWPFPSGKMYFSLPLLTFLLTRSRRDVFAFSEKKKKKA